MSTKAYINTVPNRKATSQGSPIPGREAEMVRNSQGGFTFTVSDADRFDRFLILGTEGGTYYASEQKLTKENAQFAIEYIKKNGVAAVKRIVEISEAGRAPKNDPALFALALAFTHGDSATRWAAEAALPKVARIGTHLFHLAAFVDSMRSWNLPVRRAFSNWYNNRSALSLAKQITKYQTRDGWSHIDVLRLAHPKPFSSDHAALFANLAGKAYEGEISQHVAEYMSAVEEAKSTTNAKRAIELISAYELPREVLRSELQNSPDVWYALLPHMGLEAMVRNLATMTRVGVIAPFSDGQKIVLEKMADLDAVRASKLHPMNVLIAMRTYAHGHGVRGSSVWTPVSKVVDGLDDLFYAAFGNVTPTGKRTLLGLDVSSSMTLNEIAGMPFLTPREAAAAMAMVTLRTESDVETMGFSHSFVKLAITPKMTLKQVCDVMDKTSFGGTDCALPMIWAKKNKIPGIEAFVVYTDNETRHGNIHPTQALKQYRSEFSAGAKLAVAAFSPTRFTIADPKDAGMMDFSGLDSALPIILADFIRG